MCLPKGVEIMIVKEPKSINKNLMTKECHQLFCLGKLKMNTKTKLNNHVTFKSHT